MKLLINIGGLAGCSDATEALTGENMNRFSVLEDAWLAVDNEKIAAFGSMSDGLPQMLDGTEIVDMHGRWVFPSFCDSHTHIVYAGNRAGEYLDKINGLTYEEIGRRGGGILNSADLLHRTSETELFDSAMRRLNEMIRKGTGAVEIKSGYGLNTEDEIKMLRVIAAIKEATPALVKATFLGAHAVGRSYAGRQDDYVEYVCHHMIPAVAAEGLAEYVDVFCDEGYFTPAETEKIMEAGLRYGMKPKIHANELGVSGGVQAGVKWGAVSVDHLERTGEAEYAVLRDSQTIATLLPGASFFSGLPYADGKRMIAAGLKVALASDYNPGSSPSGDMRFVASLATFRMKLTPQQALNATTINGAAAMEAAAVTGSISVGKLANFYVTETLPSLAFLTYAYTTPLIREAWLRGERVAVNVL